VKNIGKKVLVLAILLYSSIGISIDNTFSLSIIIGIANSFHKYC